MRFAAALVLSLGVVGLAQASPASPDAGDAAAQAPATGRTPDFLFGRPDGWIGIRAGALFPRARSDWYDFVSDQLTIDRRDFRAPGFAADVGMTLSRRADVVAGVSFTGASLASEYRDFVDNNRLPIAQTTRLRTVGLTGSLRLALWDRGREIGQLAFVPRRVVPFAGAGGGILWYRLEQTGDFVDFVDLSVFEHSFTSKAWTPTAHLLAGVDVGLSRRVRGTVEGRYQWAAGRLSSTWVDFDPIDLSGFTLSTGVSVVF